MMVLYVMFNGRQQHFTFLRRKNKMQMIFELPENNIKILDILSSEKLHELQKP